MGGQGRPPWHTAAIEATLGLYKRFSPFRPNWASRSRGHTYRIGMPASTLGCSSLSNSEIDGPSLPTIEQKCDFSNLPCPNPRVPPPKQSADKSFLPQNIRRPDPPRGRRSSAIAKSHKHLGCVRPILAIAKSQKPDTCARMAPMPAAAPPRRCCAPMPAASRCCARRSTPGA
jgi:hypothetical protein